MMRPYTPKGFTLIELIIVIVITGIIAAVVSPIIGSQFQAYSDSSRRATLVQEAQSVMQQLERDLYYAVPNSTVVTESTVTGEPDKIELLTLARSTDGQRLPSGRYDDGMFGDGNFEANDPVDVFGCFTVGGDDARIVVGSRNPEDTLSQYKAQSDTGPTLENFSGSDPDCDLPDNPNPKSTLTVEVAHDFAETSSFNRLYFTGSEVTYFCGESGLQRASKFDGDWDDSDSIPVSDLVDSCTFEYLIGGTYNPPSLLVSITLGEAGSEQITLTRSFQLVNAP